MCFFFRIGVTLFQSWSHELGIGQHSVEVIMSQLGGLRSKPLGAAWHEGKRTKRKVALIYTACHSWTVSLIHHLSWNFKVLSQSEMFKSRGSRDNKKARFEALLSRGVEAALESDSCHTLKVGASGHWLMIIQGITNSFGSFNDDAWTCLNINSSCSTQCPSIFKSCYSIWVLFVKHGFSGSRSWSIGSKSDRSGMSHSWMSLDRTWLYIYNQNWLVFDIYLFICFIFCPIWDDIPIDNSLSEHCNRQEVNICQKCQSIFMSWLPLWQETRAAFGNWCNSDWNPHVLHSFILMSSVSRPSILAELTAGRFQTFGIMGSPRPQV